MTHARPSLPEFGRSELAAARIGILSTVDRSDGTPFGSMVELLPRGDGGALLLLSTLAEHTRNALADARASIIVGTSLNHPLPQLCARITVCGALAPFTVEDAEREAYLSAHPHARTYVDFKDFAFYQLRPARVRVVAGFGRMGWVAGDEWSSTEPDLMHPALAGVIDHMNDDHRSNLRDYVRAFASIDTADDAIMLSLDRLGFDVAAIVDGLPQQVRLSFDEPLAHPREARKAMVNLAQRARAILDTKEQTP